MELGSGADLHIFTDDTIRPDLAAGTNSRRRMDDRRGMNQFFGHFINEIVCESLRINNHESHIGLADNFARDFANALGLADLAARFH